MPNASLYLESFRASATQHFADDLISQEPRCAPGGSPRTRSGYQASTDRGWATIASSSSSNRSGRHNPSSTRADLARSTTDNASQRCPSAARAEATRR